MDALMANARFQFHKRLFETNTLTLTSAGVASNADTSSRGVKGNLQKDCRHSSGGATPCCLHGR